MRTSGLMTMMAAAGLALACVGTANAAAPAAPAAAQPQVTVDQQPTAAGAAPAAQAPAATPATAAATPADPRLAADGTPLLKATPGIGQPTDGVMGIQTQVTANGQQARWFHDSILTPVIAVISLFVLALLLYVMFRFRASANPNPSKTSHNTTIEIIWTLAPVIILVALAVPSIRLLAAQFKPAPANAVTLKAIGNQWYWTHEYPDHGGISITSNMLKEKGEVGAGQRFRTDADGPRLLAVDNRIVLPVGVPIRLQTTAADVIHSWAMPAFWAKLDAIPGRLNETSFTIEKPGLYFGQCSELCGARHAFMPIAVEAVSPAEFAAWVRAKGGKMPGDAAAPAAAAPAAAAPAAAPAAAAPAISNEAASANTAAAAATGN